VGSAPFCGSCGDLRVAGAIIGGRYRLERLLAQDSLGLLYAGRHDLLGKEVTVKVLKLDPSTDPARARQVMQAAQRFSQLRHDNIVDITDFGQDEAGHLFVVMEPLEGASLAVLLGSGAAVSTTLAQGILLQVCQALSFAHASGMVHGGLTPHNIYLTARSGQRERAKLLDFGLSGLAGEWDPGASIASSETVPSEILAEATCYRAPEQLRDISRTEAQVDVYALGVIAHEIFTGKLPFRSTSILAILEEKLSQPALDLTGSELMRSAPAVASLISECLMTAPESRPASMAEVERRLTAGGAVKEGPAEDAHLQGKQAGSYTLVRQLGAGGLGSVWLAEHPVIGSKVAIKVLHPEMGEHPDVVRRFVIEAQAVNRIASPHIVKTFDFGKLDDGRDYAVMELLEGETLDGLIVREGPLPWHRARQIMIPLTEALVQAHEAEIVHRDLKPENIHVGPNPANPEIKVLDFGIAKLMDGSVSATHQTQLGVLVGTPLYCAPEQALGRQIDAAADIYALGVVLFELLAGSPPFVGSLQQIIGAKVKRTPSLPLQARAAAPAEVVELLGAMLSVEPAHRPAAKDVLARLGGSVGDGAALAPAATAVASPPSDPSVQLLVNPRVRPAGEAPPTRPDGKVLKAARRAEARAPVDSPAPAPRGATSRKPLLMLAAVAALLLVGAAALIKIIVPPKTIEPAAVTAPAPTAPPPRALAMPAEPDAGAAPDAARPGSAPAAGRRSPPAPRNRRRHVRKKPRPAPRPAPASAAPSAPAERPGQAPEPAHKARPRKLADPFDDAARNKARLADPFDD